MRILIAIDINDRAQAVLDAAQPWIRTLGGQAHLIYVEEYGATAALITDPSVRQAVQKEWDQIRGKQLEQLEGLLSSFPEENRGEVHVDSGRPSDRVAAASGDYDLVLVATHGRTGLGHIVLGSVAEQIVRRSKCPTLVMKLPPAS